MTLNWTISTDGSEVSWLHHIEKSENTESHWRGSFYEIVGREGTHPDQVVEPRRLGRILSSGI
jgi:hypothetical protein